ncbi:MAG: hypothetical protein WCA32_12005 [Chromatiaceae bacterium]
MTSAQNRNKGAYLHGSFGSGKSHFMAALSLLMAGHPRVRRAGRDRRALGRSCLPAAADAPMANV